MSALKKARPEVFFLPANNPAIRQGEGNKMIAHVKAQPKDENIKIVVSKGKEKRSDEQNALWRVWCLELVREHDESYTTEEYHGMNKLEVMLPMMCYDWERWSEEGEFLKVAFMSVINYRDKIKLADRYMATSELSIDEGTQYIDRLQKHWQERGVMLEVKASTKRYKNHPEANA